MIAENLDDAAFGYLAVAAVLDHALKLPFQREQSRDPAFDILKLSASDHIGGFTGLARIVCQGEQVSNRLQRKSKLPAVPDECEPINVAPVVPTLIPRRTRRLRHQSYPPVVADGLYLAAGLAGEVTNGISVGHDGLLNL
jgi:hypothetical protein